MFLSCAHVFYFLTLRRARSFFSSVYYTLPSCYQYSCQIAQSVNQTKCWLCLSVSERRLRGACLIDTRKYLLTRPGVRLHYKAVLVSF